MPDLWPEGRKGRLRQIMEGRRQRLEPRMLLAPEVGKPTFRNTYLSVTRRVWATDLSRGSRWLAMVCLFVAIVTWHWQWFRWGIYRATMTASLHTGHGGAGTCHARSSAAYLCLRFPIAGCDSTRDRACWVLTFGELMCRRRMASLRSIS